MMFNPNYANGGGGGLASLIQPLQRAIGRQLNQNMNSQMNDFGQKVEQLVSESFPGLEIDSLQGGMNQNIPRFPPFASIPSFQPFANIPRNAMGGGMSNSTGVVSFGDLNPERDAQLYPRASMGIRSLAQMLPRAT
tara:strand:- start:21 stop:428 length:408 start_codon:yes stop_codon:yes gene_type:complete